VEGGVGEELVTRSILGLQSAGFTCECVRVCVGGCGCWHVCVCE